MLDLFINLVQQHIMEDIYPAHVAQYSLKLESNEKGLVARINGFNQKISVSIKRLCSC